MKGKKHIQHMLGSSQSKLNSFFQSNLKASKEQSTVDDTVQSSSKTMDTFVYDYKSDKWVNHVHIEKCASKFFLKSRENLPKVFQKMFADSVIAETSLSEKTNIHKSVFTNEIKPSLYYSTSFDKTLNKKRQVF